MEGCQSLSVVMPVSVLTGMVVVVYLFVKAHQTVHFKWAQSISCDLHLNKGHFKHGPVNGKF